MPFVEMLAWHRVLNARAIRRMNQANRAKYEQQLAEMKKREKGG